MHPAATPLPASTSFHLAIPYILPPSLAALHATRARLLYPSDPPFSGTHCVKCGFPLTADNSQTRSVRQKRRKNKGGDAATVRVLRRSCRNCGHDEDGILGAVCPPALPKVRDRVRCKPSTHLEPHGSNVATPSSAESSPLGPISVTPRLFQQMASSSTPVPASFHRNSMTGPLSISPATSAASTVPRTQTQDVSSVQAQAKSKARQKKSGLQNMLARNRKRQEQEKREEGQSTGLSAFLQGL